MQGTKIGSTFCDWTNIVKSIPHSSTLSLLLFDIFISDQFLFSVKCEICYFAVDNSLYFYGMNLDNVFINHIQDILNIYEWFVYNSLKANPEKFQFTILGNTGSHTQQIGDITTKSNLSFFNNRKPICLLPVNLDILLKNRYAKS